MSSKFVVSDNTIACVPLSLVTQTERLSVPALNIYATSQIF